VGGCDDKLGDLEDTVWDFPVGTSTSNLHGCVCGLLCSNVSADHQTLQRTLVDLLEPEMPGIDVGAGLDELDRFSGLTRMGLDAEDFGFKPLLSEEDAPLSVRLEDLAEWCGGFLLGYGFGAPGAQPSETAQEVLEDIVRISQVDPDADPDSHAEFELFDVVEHLRMSVLLLRTDAQAPGDG
jgi:uncharacterized protein YgfB (UPF0149 family)